MACIFLKYFESKGAKSVCIGRNLATLVGTIPEAIYSFLNVGVDIGLLKEPDLYSLFIFGTVRIFFKSSVLGLQQYGAEDTEISCITPVPTHGPCKYFNKKCHY